MKIRNLMATVLVLAVAAYGSLTASANILFETFDYPDQDALMSVWNAGGTNPSYSLDTSFGNPNPSYAMPSPADNFEPRIAINLPGGAVQATDTNPLVVSMDWYLDPAGAATNWGGARHYVELRGYANGAYLDGELQNLIALGLNNASDNAFNTTFYQGRVVNGVNWQTLNGEAGAPNRTAGWQELKVTITGSEVQFSVGGILAHVAPRPNNFTFDSIALGAALTANNHDVWIDNLQVAVIPEPSTALLLGLAGLGLISFRKRS